MPLVSVTVITRNEAAHIRAALESVAWADERIVVDSGSTDETVAIAREHATRVEVRAWSGYSDQKNYAAGLARNDWVLSLDADERVSLALGDEIARALGTEPSARGFRVPRVANYLGQWIRCTDWWPDWQLRLYDRRAGQWDRVPRTRVRAAERADGHAARRAAPLSLHGDFRSPRHDRPLHDAGGREMRAQGRRSSWGGSPSTRRWRSRATTSLRGGFRQGTPGLIVSLLNSYYVLLKFAKLWELQQQTRAAGTSSPSDR